MALVAPACSDEPATKVYPAATTAAPTTSAALPTTTTAVVGVGLEAECAESSAGGPHFAFADDSALDQFGPLTAEPSLRIKVPLIRLGQGGRIPGVEASRIPGGVMLSVGPVTSGVDGGSLLAAVDADGGIRWVRCFDYPVTNILVAAASAAPTRGLIGYPTSITDDGSFLYAWEQIDLDTGEILRAFSELSGPVLSASATDALFGPVGAEEAAADGRQLDLLDLTTWSMTSIPYPIEQTRDSSAESFLGFTDTGEVALYQWKNHWLLATNVYRDGSWVTDPNDATHGVHAGSTNDYPRMLAGFDSAGTEVWRLDDYITRGGEIPSFMTAGDITVVWVCSLSGETNCDENLDVAMLGVDTETGDVRWQRGNALLVHSVGEGRELILQYDEGSSKSEWLIIDLASGQEVERPAQMPDAQLFLSYGEGSPRIQWFGGVLVISHGNEVSVWYPAGVAPTPTEVSLP